jgi:hypothetical protein
MTQGHPGPVEPLSGRRFCRTADAPPLARCGRALPCVPRSVARIPILGLPRLPGEAISLALFTLSVGMIEQLSLSPRWGKGRGLGWRQGAALESAVWRRRHLSSRSRLSGRTPSQPFPIEGKGVSLQAHTQRELGHFFSPPMLAPVGRCAPRAQRFRQSAHPDPAPGRRVRSAAGRAVHLPRAQRRARRRLLPDPALAGGGAGRPGGALSRPTPRRWRRGPSRFPRRLRCGAPWPAATS